MVIAPSINTGTFGVAPQDAGVASATVTVGHEAGQRGHAVLGDIGDIGPGYVGSINIGPRRRRQGVRAAATCAVSSELRT